MSLSKIFLSVCFSSHLFILHSQSLAVIDDNDGYTNVRATPDLSSKIVGRLYDGDVFFSSMAKENNEWYYVSYYQILKTSETTKREFFSKQLGLKSDTISFEGFAHKSRIIPISSFQKLERHQTKNKLSVKNDTLLFKIELVKFEPSKHKIIGNSQAPGKIDGLYPFGVFDRLPTVEIKSVELNINNRDTKIPKSEFSDCYEIDLTRMNLYSGKRGFMYIASSNSDGAGGYEAIWIIKSGKYFKREIFIP